LMLESHISWLWRQQVRPKQLCFVLSRRTYL
jgi:hypothetical protein